MTQPQPYSFHSPQKSTEAKICRYKQLSHIAGYAYVRMKGAAGYSAMPTFSLKCKSCKAAEFASAMQMLAIELFEGCKPVAQINAKPRRTPL
jgi:hypothetical protein